MPDRIILMGDFLTLESLSDWDKNHRKAMEGRRYWEEIEAGNRALNAIDLCILNAQKKQKRSKKKAYAPEKVFIYGNHENRLERYHNSNPIFDDGSTSIRSNLDLDKRNYTCVNYGDHYVVEDCRFTHIPFSMADKPISGMGVARKALARYSGSVVFGHTHRKEVDYSKNLDATTNKIAYSCGCFFEHNEEYKLAPDAYPTWRGVSILHHYSSTEFDIEEINIKRLRDESI